MAVESIGAVLTEGDPSLSRAGLGQDDFLEILLKQLTTQDPLKPLENQEFLAQLAQFVTLEQSIELNGRLDSLLTQQSATQSVGLLGRTVEVRTNTGSSIGEVTAVGFRQGEPSLTISSASGGVLTDVRLAQISIVR